MYGASYAFLWVPNDFSIHSSPSFFLVLLCHEHFVFIWFICLFIVSVFETHLKVLRDCSWQKVQKSFLLGLGDLMRYLGSNPGLCARQKALQSVLSICPRIMDILKGYFNSPLTLNGRGFMLWITLPVKFCRLSPLLKGSLKFLSLFLLSSLCLFCFCFILSNKSTLHSLLVKAY